MNVDYHQEIHSVFLDTAPVIYYVERHQDFYPILKTVFDRFDNGELKAAISPITIAESLIIPIRKNNYSIVNVFIEFFENEDNVSCVPILKTTAWQAAEMRSQYNIALLDAFQLILAMENNCDTFLTNDKELLRVKGIQVLTIEQLKEEFS